MSEPNRVGVASKAGPKTSFNGILFLAGFLALALTVVSLVFGKVVYPGEIGVRQITMGPGQGFAAEGLEPGLHWSIPFYSQIRIIPQTVRSLDLDRDTKLFPGTMGSLDITTADGASVKADISILTRFYRTRGSEGAADHGGPVDLIQKSGLTEGAWNSTIYQVSSNELRKALGGLSYEQFYNLELRDKALDAAKDSISIALADYGIQVEAVLMRRYTYASEEIDNAIFQKNLQVQEEQLNEASSRFAGVKAQLEQVSAELDAKISTLKVSGENRARVIRSEGDLFEAKKVAEADLLVAKSQAEVDRLRAGALAQSAGADAYVARELAPLLTSLRGGVVSNIDPYDLEQWVRRLGLSGGKAQ